MTSEQRETLERLLGHCRQVLPFMSNSAQVEEWEARAAALDAALVELDAIKEVPGLLRRLRYTLDTVRNMDDLAAWRRLCELMPGLASPEQ